MKLLLDANLSWRLTPRLKQHFEACFHVDYMGLTVPAKDTEIWNYASLHHLIIITNDIDFLNPANEIGFPAKSCCIKNRQSKQHFYRNFINKTQSRYSRFKPIRRV